MLAIANGRDTRFPTMIGQSASARRASKRDKGRSAVVPMAARPQACLPRQVYESPGVTGFGFARRAMIYRPRGRLAATRVLICIAMNPYQHLIRRWNWKTACLSAFFRGILILLANLSAGGTSAVGAMLAEACYRALTSGFYSALTQAFRFAQPVWAASAIPMVLIPIVSDSGEFAMHGLRGTQRLGTTVAASVIFTAISTLFELFLMRRGVLVMGKNRRPLVEDLKSIPQLIVDFLSDGTRLLFSIRIPPWRERAGRPTGMPVLPAFVSGKPVRATAKPIE